MIVLQSYLSRSSYVGLQVLPISCRAWSFQSCSKRGLRKPDYDLHPEQARPSSAGIPADFSKAVSQGAVGDEEGDRNLAPGIHAGHSYTPSHASGGWDHVLCSHAWVYPWDRFIVWVIGRSTGSFCSWKFGSFTWKVKYVPVVCHLCSHTLVRKFYFQSAN